MKLPRNSIERCFSLFTLLSFHFLSLVNFSIQSGKKDEYIVWIGYVRKTGRETDGFSATCYCYVRKKNLRDFNIVMHRRNVKQKIFLFLWQHFFSISHYFLTRVDLVVTSYPLLGKISKKYPLL